MFLDIEKKPWNPGCAFNKDYRDYHHLRDDKTVLKNPHKGWYWHFIDNGMQRDDYRADINPDDNLSDFPGLHHLYLRFDWADIEKQEGVYDWDYIDQVIGHWSQFGYRFSLRICTFEGEGIEYATPVWVRKAGANGWDCDCKAWQPDFDDPIYLEKLGNFMKEVGRKFNKHPLIEFVDVGTFGTWGEGHTGHCKKVQYPYETLKKHVNLHLKYFPDKPVIVNDDMINNGYNSDEGRLEFFRYCVGKGLGIRDDTVLCEGYSGPRYDNLRTPFLFDEFYENAPVDIEIQHYHMIEDFTMKDGFPLYESLKRTHASYCGFHGYPRPWLQKFPYMTEHLANKLGYWYFLNGAEIPECVEGYPSVMKLYIENKGFCHAYHPYDLKVKLVSVENGEEFEVLSEEGRNLNWKAESHNIENLKLDLSKVSAGEYIICIGLFEGEIPIKMGFVKECCRADGFYEFDIIEVKKEI